MSNQSNIAVQRKVTVTLPDDLLVRLDERIPPRQRSSFIAEAIETQLALAEQQAALEEAAGAWRDEHHPDMVNDTDIDAWLITLRQSWSGEEDE